MSLVHSSPPPAPPPTPDPASAGPAARSGGADPTPDAAALVLSAVRSRRPLVHQIAGPAVLADTANAILALGGSPVLAVAPEEAAEMAAQASAVVLNLGMLSADRLESMLLAGAAANRLAIPVILDPVGVGGTAFRSAAVRELLAAVSIAVVRGNVSEIGHLAGRGGSVRGVDAVVPAAPAVATEASAAAPTVAAEDAIALSRRLGTVVAATGPLDVVTDGSRLAIVRNGTPMLARISGSGCMVSAMVGCCAGVEPDALLAAVTALVAMGIAGEQAARWSNGPGSFKAVLMDCLAALSPDDLLAEARIDARADSAPGLGPGEA